MVLSPKAQYIAAPAGPNWDAEISEIARQVGVEGPSSLLFLRPTGCRIHSPATEPVCIALPNLAQSGNSLLEAWSPVVPHASSTMPEAVTLHVRSCMVRAELQTGQPFAAMPALGWTVQVAKFSARLAEPCLLRCLPAVGRIRPSSTDLKELIRVWHVASYLDRRACTPQQSDARRVEVQVCARRMWQGYLPDSFDLEALQQLWKAYSEPLQLLSGIRVFSGPFPQVHARAIGDICLSPWKVVRKTGELLVSLMPEVRGGGVKEENKQLAVSRVAALCLDRGISLTEVSKSGANAVLAALQANDISVRWAALEGLAKQHDLKLPQGDNRTERAARRIQRAVQKQKLRRAREVRAEDFQLDASFWLSMGRNACAHTEPCGIALIRCTTEGC